MQLGDHDFCLERVDLARRPSPFDPLIYGMHGITAMSMVLRERYDEALKHAAEALGPPDLHYQARAMGIVIYAMAGEPELATEQLRIVLAVNPDYDLKEFFSVYAFRKDEDIRRVKHVFEEIRRLV